jgi:hypothetical protein
MNVILLLILISAFSFLGYGITYFTSLEMRIEMKRFSLERYGTLTAVVQLCGGIGLLVGLVSEAILLISSGGLALLMLFAVGARLKVRDNFGALVPALFFMLLNACIFYSSVQNK